MAKLAEKNILDYRQGGDTVDDFAQKYMAEMTRIYQFLNNIRTHNLDGTEQVEPEAYQLKAEDNKLYIRNAENSKWLYLFDVKYRMGMSDNVEATILTTDDVTSTTEALKLVKTNADGKVEVDTLGNANTATVLQTGRELVITDSSGTNKGTAVVFDGSKNIEIAMPSTIGGDFKGTFNGSGDITGTFSGDSIGTFNGTGALEGTFKGEATGTFTGDLTGTFKGTASEYVPVTDIGTGTTGDIITTNGKLVKIDEDGLLPVDIRGNAGKLAGTRVAITNPEDGQVLAYRAASKTWNNEARAVIGEGKALSVYDGETLVAEYAGSKEVSFDLEKTAIKDSISTNTADIATANGKITAIVDGTTPVAKATTADNCTGNSATATKLETARTISLTGAVTGSGTFDGSGDIRIVTTESPTAYNRNALWSVSGRCNLVSPSWYKVGVNGTCYMVSSSSTLNLNTASSWDNSTYATAANRAGKDFYIYACDTGSSLKIVLSANSTVPTGYTSGTSRKVGGFHCLCLSVGTISGHTLSGYVTGDILPASVWDLLHRPVSEPEGMVWSGREWVDIYLASWNGSRLVSVYGGTIADGYSSTPFHGELFVEKFGLVNKRLPLRDQFVAFAKGSNEMTNIKGSSDPGTTGGHYDTAGRRMISNIGCEDCCGALWQWTADITGLGNQYYLDTTNKAITNLPEITAQTSSAAGGHWIYGCTWQSDGRGTANINIDGATNKYGQTYGIFTRARAGGRWVDGSHCGSRSAALDGLSSNRAAFCAGRGASEPRAVSL